MRIKTLIAFIIFEIMTTTAWSQSLSGNVTDSTGKALPFATVFVPAKNCSFVADQHGHYTVCGVDEGECCVEFSHVGYKNRKITVVLRAGDNKQLDVALTEYEVELGEVTVHSRDMVAWLLDSVASRKPLKSLIKTYVCDAKCNIETIGNLAEFPAELIKTFKIFSWVIGYEKIFECFIAHADLRLTIACRLAFNKGKCTVSDKAISWSSCQLTEKEQAAFLHKNWHLNDDIYEKTYAKIRKIRHYDAKYLKKHGAHYVKYKGTYDNGGRKIYVLTYGDAEIHIVEGCWQVSRTTECKPAEQICTEFQEIFPGIFLPINVTDIWHFGDTDMCWSLTETNSFQYNNIIK